VCLICRDHKKNKELDESMHETLRTSLLAWFKSARAQAGASWEAVV